MDMAVCWVFYAIQKFIAEFTKAHHGPYFETAVSNPHVSGRIFDAVRCYCDECTFLTEIVV